MAGAAAAFVTLQRRRQATLGTDPKTLEGAVPEMRGVRQGPWQ